MNNSVDDCGGMFFSAAASAEEHERHLRIAVRLEREYAPRLVAMQIDVDIFQIMFMRPAYSQPAGLVRQRVAGGLRRGGLHLHGVHRT